jgi:hypothetical protein
MLESDGVSELVGHQCEADHVLAAESVKHFPCDSACDDPVEERVARDQERSLESFETCHAELVPSPGSDEAKVEPARANHAHRTRLHLGDFVACRLERDLDAERSVREFRHTGREVPRGRAVGLIDAVADS